ncbi:MAG: hypothetical protein HY736_18705 [Verrucomicrobia bacterium]|nr:hypothetical protein [Verrucomicrobiota bacterium]
MNLVEVDGWASAEDANHKKFTQATTILFNPLTARDADSGNPKITR